MESGLNTATVFCLAASAVVAVWYLLDYFYVPPHLPDEPPVLSPSIPYIGHIIGLLRHGTRYYQITSAKCKLPIYTLPVLNGKIYVVTSPQLVNAVNRNSKVLSFNPFIAQLGKRITGHDEATSQTVQHNLTGENGTGYVIEVHDGTVTALAPGKNLETMTETMLREAWIYLDKLKDDHEIDLFTWTQHMVTLCSTRAIYGPENPFNRDPKLLGSFWDFERDLNLLIIDIAPHILVPKGNRARSVLGHAFTSYFDQFSPEKSQSSAYAQARSAANTKYDITTQNQGLLEVGTLLGILANTIPAIFYMIINIYSDPNLLRDIRSEIETTCVSSSPSPNPGSTTTTTRRIRILSLRERCPLLNSTWQELLRVHALGNSARFVREDIMLDNKHLLKKGMVVQIPMAVMHSDPTVWGTDVTQFQPRRFLQSSKQSSTSTAYRPFGGGASLCPGRHFVTLETLALTACMVMRYDMASVDGGRLSVPPQKQNNLATNVFPPERDVRVKITGREECRNVTWDFVMT